MGSPWWPTRLLGSRLDRLHPALSWALTFGYVNFCWIFFRAGSVREALAMCRAIARCAFGPLAEEFTTSFQMPEITWIGRYLEIDMARLALLMFLLFVVGSMFFCLQETPVARRKHRMTGRRGVLAGILLFWAVISLTGVNAGLSILISERGRHSVPKRFLRLFFAVFLALTALFAGTIYVVDPYYHYHGPVAGLPLWLQDGRYQNVGAAENLDYDYLLMGTSVTANFTLEPFQQRLPGQTRKLIVQGGYFEDFLLPLDVALETHTVRAGFLGGGLQLLAAV